MQGGHLTAPVLLGTVSSALCPGASSCYAETLRDRRSTWAHGSQDSPSDDLRSPRLLSPGPPAPCTLAKVLGTASFKAGHLGSVERPTACAHHRAGSIPESSGSPISARIGGTYPEMRKEPPRRRKPNRSQGSHGAGRSSTEVRRETLKWKGGPWGRVL